MRFFLFLLPLFAPLFLAAQGDPHPHLRDGDLAYRANDYAEAELAYRRALNEAPSGQAQYNLGNTLYQQQRYDEAMQAYAAAGEQLGDPALEAAAYYNLGNAAAQQQNWQEAVDAYRNALRRDPNDSATKYNYAQALERLRQQEQEQEQQQQENQENQEQNEQEQNEQEQNQEESEQEQNQEQDPGESEQPQEQPGEGEGEGEEEQQQQPQPDEQEIDNDAQQQPGQAVSVSRQQAEELLKIIEREEQKVQEKIRKGKATNRRSDKDW